MNKKILIIEDDVDISKLIGSALDSDDYATEYAYSGSEALLLLQQSEYDLIISDLMLPGVNGEEIIKLYGGKIPIIIVSAKADINDKVNNLLNGAIDYLTKPFSVEELLARVAVQLRKNNSSPITKNEIVYIDEELNTAFANGHALKLTKTELALLKIFLSNPKRIFSKTQLIDSISANSEVWESSVNVHISNLRKKLAAYTDTNYIEAVWGIGYRFLPEKKS